MATVGFEKQKVWKLNMILILISKRIENVEWHEFKWGFKIQGVQALEEISTQNGPPKKINKIIVKIIK